MKTPRTPATAIRAPRPPAPVALDREVEDKLVEMHRGTIEAHSQGPGNGSEFVKLAGTMQETHAEAAALAGTIASPAPGIVW